MKVSSITLQQHADIYEALNTAGTLEVYHAGTEPVFCGEHEELGPVIMFQNGTSNSAVLIELGKAA